MDDYIETFWHFFDKDEPIFNMSGNLPHWRQENTPYFVTYRLADSLPKTKVDQWEDERNRWLEEHPEPHDKETRTQYHLLFTQRFHEWLDAGYGSCILKNHQNALIVSNAFHYFDKERYVIDEYKVMPNHIHVIVSPINGYSLSSIIHSWKSFTSNEINTQMNRQGTVWQKECFDHIIRGHDQLFRIREYIRNNGKTRQDAASTF